METYIQHLAKGESSSDGGKTWQDGGVRLDDYEAWVSGGGKITTTGYSLGAHMSTAATMMHPELIAQTYNYNAAGIGGMRDGVGSSAFHEPAGAEISDLITIYTQMMKYTGPIQPVSKRGWYLNIIETGKLQEFTDLLASTQQQQYDNLYDNPLHTFVTDYLRSYVYPAGTGIVPLVGEGLGDTLVRNAFFKYVASGLDPNSFTSDEFELEQNYPISQIFGHGEFFDPEFVANGGYHQKPNQIWIEHQPMFREDAW
jgi:hypothetical protein